MCTVQHCSLDSGDVLDLGFCDVADGINALKKCHS